MTSTSDLLMVSETQILCIPEVLNSKAVIFLAFADGITWIAAMHVTRHNKMFVPVCSMAEILYGARGLLRISASVCSFLLEKQPCARVRHT